MALYVRIDVGQVPPTVEVHEQDDFTRFHVLVTETDHSWVDPDALTELAGRTGDGEWRRKLSEMVGYAQTKGWLDQGRIRAHVEAERA